MENENVNENEDIKKKKRGMGERKRFAPPTLSDVEAYCREKKLNVDAKRFYDFFTAGNWVDSRGQPVRNWKQKLLTWDNHAPKKAETKQPDYSKGEDFFD